MKSFLAFSPYEPDENDELAQRIRAFLPYARFISDVQGNDWYACQKAFSDETIKIAWDEQGVIRFIHPDASCLFPVGLSVAEVSPEDMPEGADCDGQWIFDGQSIKRREVTGTEKAAIAEAQRAELMALATEQIAPLQDAEDIGDATPDETAALLAWKKYRIALNRLDVTAENINWPVAPVTK